ncbi:hypothetical protein NY828_20860, partial [Escherichia coli]|nr:hypothetical protein [Escherichia coli]
VTKERKQIHPEDIHLTAKDFEASKDNISKDEWENLHATRRRIDMSNHHYIASIAFTASAMLASAAAFAHPKLLSSMPTDKAEGAAPAMIELKFSESLFTQYSGANLVMTEMPGMSEHDA